MTHGSSDRLTARELEVLGMLAEFYTDQEIATKLVVSVRTVESHVSHILEKLDARDRREAARKLRTVTRSARKKIRTQY
jgi:DNA-binding NarL/FixJ family response regulator